MNALKPLYFLCVCAIGCLLPGAVFAQTETVSTEHRLIETYWKYAYTVHLETGTLVHQAEPQYEVITVFHFDSIYRLYNNGLTLEGKWKLEQGILHFPFKQAQQFRLTAVTESILELSFNSPNSPGTFLYHFNATDKPHAMFARREGELPEFVLIKKGNKRPPARVDSDERKFSRFMPWRKQEAEQPFIPIQIELTGGGFYGGIDPVLRDHIVIKSDGRLVQEFKTKGRGLLVTKQDIPRHELEAFVSWVEEQKFFEMQRQYDCTSKLCKKRQEISPKPTPLRLIIRHGNRRKMVTVAIYGRDKSGQRFIDYPTQLDNIVDAIQRMASRVEQ